MSKPHLSPSIRFVLSSFTLALTALLVGPGCDANPEGPSVPSTATAPTAGEDLGGPAGKKTKSKRTKAAPGPRSPMDNG